MATPPTSTLSPPPQPLGLAVIASIALHLMGVVTFCGWTLLCGASVPVSDLTDRSVDISFATIRQADGLPQLATRPPEPPGVQQPEPVPAAAPEPAEPEPPPVRESDLVLNTPDPEPVAPAPPDPAPPAAPDRSREREEAMARAVARQAALDRARLGSEYQEATDPNGNSDETIQSEGAGDPGDPELARWKQRTEAVFLDAFSPLQTDPNLAAIVSVSFNPTTGAVSSPSLAQPSGNASFDAAAVRAAASITSVDPPPEKFRSIVGGRLRITFVPK